MLQLLYAVFILSGAAGLIYESIWTRYLGLFVGHSAYAQVLVLVIFLGGMSIGAFILGARSERVKEPLLWYAGVELVTGLIGLVFHDAYGVITGFAYEVVFPALGPGPVQSIAKWTIAGLLILPQSILLGTTFPLMSAAVLRRSGARSGRALSLVYFTNSIGAAAGVLVAGFYLVAVAGLPGTLLAAAIINLAIAAVVVVGLRLSGESPPLPAAGMARHSPVDGGPITNDTRRVDREHLRELLLVVSFVTALSSFIYEIAWIRMLSLVLGSATHSFELMLSAFILGLALGAYWIRGRADEGASSLRLLGIVQLSMGALAVATLPLYVASFDWMANIMAAFAKSEQGYLAFSVARYGLCLAIMLPATFCAGMTLPIITRVLLASGVGERSVGQVYGINTLGSIVGAATAGLVLMPMVGLKWLLVVGAALDLVLGAVLLWRDGHTARGAAESPRRVWRTATAALVVGVAVALLVAAVRLDPALLTSGVFRTGTVYRAATNPVLYYRDGRTATVSVRRIESTKGLSLATNGKADASLGPEWLRPGFPSDVPQPFTHDASTQYLSSLITMAFAPDARNVAVIGQGSGMSSHVLLGSPALKRLVTIEIEPEMIRASRLFYPANRRVFEDPRSHFALDDARSYFATQGQKFDVILSEPSNPWVAGVSGLFTTEFYARVRSYLTPTGVFGQWIHMSEIDDRLLVSVVAALAKNFPVYAIFVVSHHDLLIVATTQEALPEPAWTQVLAFPEIASELRRTVPLTPQTLETLRVADQIALAPLLKHVSAPNSDYFPTLDLGTEKTRYMKSEASGFGALNADRFSIAVAASGRRNAFSSELVAPLNGVPRLDAAVLSTRLRDPSGFGSNLDVVRGTYARRALDRIVASAEPPSEWHLWVKSIVEVERAMHGGTAGVADSAFYAQVRAYLARAHPAAPEEAVAAVDFLHGIATWNYAEAARATDLLIAAAARQDLWLEPDLLRDGAVMAKLAVGDREGARRAYHVVAPFTTRPATDVRTQLLAAYVMDATAGPGAMPPTVLSQHAPAP